MMNAYRKLRLYHAMLASSALAAFATGESGIVHAWIGYALCGIILFRLAWGMFGPSQFRIGRFLRDLASLVRIRAANDPPLLACSWEAWWLRFCFGIVLDRLGASHAIAEARTVPVPRLDRRMPVSPVKAVATSERADEAEDDENEGWLREIHEFSANLMLLFVGLHVSYMLLLRRPLAMFMLFRPGQKQKAA